MNKMKKLVIGNVTLDTPVILAPMAGVTDLPFRVICAEQGCGMVCTEMVSAKAVFYKNKNTAPLLKTDPRERPVSLQLFGSEPELLARDRSGAGAGRRMIFWTLIWAVRCPRWSTTVKARR